SCASCATCCGLLPSALHFQICLLPERVDKKTILVPSGAALGDQSWVSLENNFCWFAPSTLVVQSDRLPSANASKTIRSFESHESVSGQQASRFSAWPSVAFSSVMTIFVSRS